MAMIRVEFRSPYALSVSFLWCFLDSVLIDWAVHLE